MYFGNRWVPMEVMDTIVLLWAIMALVIGFILFRLNRMDRAARSKQESSSKVGNTKKKKKRRR